MCRATLSGCLLLISLLLLPVPVPAQPQPKLTAKELRQLLEEARKKHDLPALAAGIIRGDGKPVMAVVGVRKRGADTLAGADDLWHLGSNTKPMTALLLALLIDLGLLDWDTPLAAIFPELAGDWNDAQKNITPTHLLTHTSGLPANWPVGWFLLARKGTPAEQRANMMKNLANVKLEKKAGEKYLYSNLGYTVIGAIIDRLSKSSWEEQLEKKIFQPLGITKAGLGPTGLLQPWPHQKNGDPVGEKVVQDNPPVMNPAGRAHMSFADYGRFLAETLRLARGGKGLLKPATAQKLFTNPHPASRHSLSGWVGFRKQPGDKGLALTHNGSNTFNYCTAVVLPDHNLAVCVLTNQGSDPGKNACSDLRELIVKREKS